jgi:hypothetical protein
VREVNRLCAGAAGDASGHGVPKRWWCKVGACLGEGVLGEGVQTEHSMGLSHRVRRLLYTGAPGSLSVREYPVLSYAVHTFGTRETASPRRPPRS